MLLELEKNLSDDQVEAILSDIKSLGVGALHSKGQEVSVIALSKNHGDLRELESLKGVNKVHQSPKPYKLVSKSNLFQRTIIDVKGVKIGGEEVILMAGPCAVESFEQLMCCGAAVKEAGGKILRASSYKPRSSPYSFQGLGKEGLKIHKEVGSYYGLVTETEIMDPRDIDVILDNIDILRIGSRNMQNFELLKEVGRCQKPIILKRGLSATIEEWLMSAEYILSQGNHQVILCERGIRTFEKETRNTLDVSAVAIAKEYSHLPVIVDPSHAAGRPDIIPALSLAAIVVGADGLLIEMHHNPIEALCDKEQALTPKELHELVKKGKVVANSIGRSL